MKREICSELNQLFFEYITLYHYKVGFIFNKEDDIFPKCTKNQRKALFVIKNEKQVIQTELGRALDLSKSTLTALLDSLENLGLVKRQYDLNDRRKHWVELTESGKTYTDSKLKLYENEISKLFQNKNDIEGLDAADHLREVISFIRQL